MPYLSNTPSTPPKQFPTLVTDLSTALGPNAGLDSAEVDPLHIRRLMEAYTSNPDEWGPFALADPSRTYTRNLIDEGNGKSNLLILVWSPGKGSSIHDHAGAHCVMKILQGTLRETLYTWPDSTKLQSGDSSPPQITKETLYGENDVAYMSDKLGLHKISNPDPGELAVSLHLYTPPNAATHGFSVFDEQSGKARHIKQTDYYSVRGTRC